MSLSVIGAGAFGTALAISIARSGKQVTLWGRNQDHIADMQVARENAARLPGVSFPEAMFVTPEVDVAMADTILLALPMQQIRHFLTTTPEIGGRVLIACCKGVELETELGPVSVIRDCSPEATPAILTGPSFAADIARGLPTALTLAIQADATGQKLQEQISTPNIRIYRTTDTIGAELGGALKNVMAIACGVAIGAGLGESARAALMTRGFAEMQRMAQALGALPETLSGLSGFGDLALTCTSDQSRNYRFGLSLGRNEDFDKSITVEGAATARAVQARADHMDIDMPITNAVVGLIDHDLKVSQAMEMLLSRPPKEE